MVWLTGPAPSVLSEWVQARERDPSTEPALVRDAVLERARRVMLAEGTVGGENSALDKTCKCVDIGRGQEVMLMWTAAGCRQRQPTGGPDWSAWRRAACGAAQLPTRRSAL
ncbi:hypothetical protein EYF80_067773 [Liparis tanakae]|uniref:Uncharacterized protein n=1 Tax=Liparis tanakae TaxID=230148 RepID=A0A4Z2E018_9TELE|nr:hypothetical protein EYF80_067773 [Liparis tanakae]